MYCTMGDSSQPALSVKGKQMKVQKKTSQRRMYNKRLHRTDPTQVLVADQEFSLAAGDVQLLDGKWYVTHSGLLRLARKNRCSGIHTEAVAEFCDPALNRWVIKAIVFKTPRSKGFVGYGDADPTNVSSLVRGAEMRVAETRAVNRALRKAYGIGLCSVEEIGTFPIAPDSPCNAKRLPARSGPVNGNGQHPLRDRLCLLIRKHELDANLVKLYAADFCETESLRQASREQVQGFINHLAQYAEHDRDGLLCQLNSYCREPVSAAEPSPTTDEKAAGAA
jgi:hypothetical protein